jgi:DNA-binding XRE family transcriptional regulator
MVEHGALSEQDISALRLEMSKKRADSGMTYNALAEKSGVSRRTVISIETGTSRGSLDTWMRIYNALDSDFGSILQGIKNPGSLGADKNLYPDMPLAEYITPNA